MIPEEKKCLSGSVLKVIAVITMLIDHTAHHLLSQVAGCTQTLCSVLGQDVSVYLLCRWIGRIAFPLYCFLIAEGFHYTHDRKKYAGNLLLFALISEIPWNLEHTGTIFYEGQNVFFTLFLGVLCLLFYEEYQQNRTKQMLYMFLTVFVAVCLQADYGLKGIACILTVYLLKEKPVPRAVIAGGMLNYPLACMLAFVPIAFYNHKRGFIQGKIWKYAFYAIYPVHMLILYLIKLKLFGYPQIS